MNSISSYKSEVANVPIYLLHGWGMNQNVWLLVLNELRQQLDNEIYPLDLPGYGNNDVCPQPYNLMNLTAWLAEQVEQKAIIIGWSLGGLVAQQFAYSHPEKVAKLGLVASTAKFVKEEQWPGIKPNVLAMFAQQLQNDHQQTIEKFMAIQAFGSPDAKRDIKQIKELVLTAGSPNKHALLAGLTMLEQVDIRQQLTELSMPVAALFGRLDSLVPAKTTKELQGLNAGIDIHVIDSASHAPFISHKAEFIDWFCQFVRD